MKRTKLPPLVASDLRAPKAGRELDKLVSEYVFDLKVFQPKDYCNGEGIMEGSTDYFYIPSKKSPRTHMIDSHPIPPFSTDIAPAWQIILYLLNRGIWTNVGVHSHNRGVRVEMGRPSEQIESWADTAPLAICTTALKFIERDQNA